MFKINGTTMTLTRGDTAFITVQMYDSDGETYTPSDGDTIYFNVKRKYTDASTIIKKEVPLDTMILELEPSDTKSMSFKNYIYEFEYTDSEGHVDTFINGTLTITGEVD